jgi:hypothetical protein
LCPTFNVVAKTEAHRHPSHDPSIPIDPYYSYTMNAYLGSKTGALGGGVLRQSEITRPKSEVFFFSEESMWTRPGCSNVLNDNALCPDGRDWFGAVREVRLALQQAAALGLFGLGPPGQRIFSQPRRGTARPANLSFRARTSPYLKAALAPQNGGFTGKKTRKSDLTRTPREQYNT